MRIALPGTATFVALALMASSARAALVEHDVLPRETDPAVSTNLDFHVAYVDTSAPSNGRLFVFLPGTQGLPRFYKLIVQEAAKSGFLAIGLTYPNDKAEGVVCAGSPDVDCAEKFHVETLTGQDVSALISVAPADAIENRLLKALQFLANRYPSEGWGNFVDGNVLRWGKIRVGGHSQGGGHAAFMGKDLVLDGITCLSSPDDWDTRLNAPSAWIAKPRATPASRMWGFGNVNDDLVPFAHATANWNLFGMGAFGATSSVDSGSAPWGNGSHELSTALNSGTSSHNMPAVDVATPKAADGSALFAPVWRQIAFTVTAEATWILPSSAHAAGAGGAFYTTDLLIANPEALDTTFVLKFLGHDADGRTGTERAFTLGAGRSVTYMDVLGSVFGASNDYGAIQIRSTTSSLLVSSETSTPSASGGTFGQAVPAFAAAELIGIAPRTILGAREDASFRTNLILANATEAGIDVLVRWYDVNGALAASRTATLAPLGMTQMTRVLSTLGVSPAAGGRLTVASATDGASFAAYAAVIDEATNDPRTLLPR